MLIPSKNEALLLGLFFTNPDREYYIQEIGRILGKKPGTFQRMLYKLESHGILSSRYSANARFFRANRSHPLFEEAKSVVFKTTGAAGRLKGALTDMAGVEFAWIYGSFAKAAENPMSDVDLLIVGSPDEKLITAKLDALEKRLGREINYRTRSSIEIVREFRGAEPFLLHVLAGPKVFLIGDEDGLRRLLERQPDQEGGPGP